MRQTPSKRKTDGFTLVELAIVLVIIGLIVGGVLVGQDLIKAAEVRATVSQVEKFNTAVNTFRLKYNALPGDMNASTATQFGFAARGTGGAGGYAGAGDGNALIEGFSNGGVPDTNCGPCPGAGEPVLLWNDLTYANGLNINLVEGNFNPSGSSGPAGNPAPGAVSGGTVDRWMPLSKLKGRIYFYAWSRNGSNYFGLSGVTSLSYYQSFSDASIVVMQANDIDRKMDDGLPQSGNVIALYVNGSSEAWAGATGTTATTGSATTCYDNGNVSGATQRYSVGQNGGAGLNCGLSFKFQ